MKGIKFLWIVLVLCVGNAHGTFAQLDSLPVNEADSVIYKRWVGSNVKPTNMEEFKHLLSESIWYRDSAIIDARIREFYRDGIIEGAYLNFMKFLDVYAQYIYEVSTDKEEREDLYREITACKVAVGEGLLFLDKDYSRWLHDIRIASMKVADERGDFRVVLERLDTMSAFIRADNNYLFEAQAVKIEQLISDVEESVCRCLARAKKEIPYYERLRFFDRYKGIDKAFRGVSSTEEEGEELRAMADTIEGVFESNLERALVKRCLDRTNEYYRRSEQGTSKYYFSRNKKEDIRIKASFRRFGIRVLVQSITLDLDIVQRDYSLDNRVAQQQGKIEKTVVLIKEDYDYKDTISYSYKEFSGKKRRLFGKLNRQQIRLGKIKKSKLNIMTVDKIPVVVTFLRMPMEGLSFLDKNPRAWKIMDVGIPKDLKRTDGSSLNISFSKEILHKEPFNSSVVLSAMLTRGQDKTANLEWEFGIETNPDDLSDVKLTYLPANSETLLNSLEVEKKSFYTTNLSDIRTDFLEELRTKLNIKIEEK